MDTSCSSYGEEKKCIQGFRKANLREGGHWKDPGVDGKIILVDLKRWDRGMDWIDLALDRDR